MSSVLGHKKELFLIIKAFVSVNFSEGWINPVTTSLSVSTVNTTLTCEPFKGKSRSLISESEWEALTPMMQLPLFVRLSSVVTSMVVLWVPCMFGWP